MNTVIFAQLQVLVFCFVGFFLNLALKVAPRLQISGGEVGG